MSGNISVDEVCELFNIPPQLIVEFDRTQELETEDFEKSFLSNLFGMIDNQTELTFERRAALLTNDGYFDRVRELCAEGKSVKEAWEQVESELPLNLRRFTRYIAFRYARVQDANNTLPKPQFKLA